MTKPRKPSTAAQLRADIDSGLGADKAPGFDPAAAPMETDAEAGGTPPSAAEIETARRHERRSETPPDANAASPVNTPDGERPRSGRNLWAAALALALVALLFFLLWR